MPKLPIIICMILVLSLWPVEARTYIVGNDGLATHKSIGEAISAASAGDTVYMKSGVYKEEVTIDKKIAIKPLIGERGTILMDGSGKGTGITLPLPAVRSRDSPLRTSQKLELLFIQMITR